MYQGTVVSNDSEAILQGEKNVTTDQHVTSNYVAEAERVGKLVSYGSWQKRQN